MKKIPIIFIFLLSNLIFFAQSVPQIEWEKTFGEKKSEQAYSIIQTTDKGFAILGGINATLVNNAWFIKTDNNGNIQADKPQKNYWIEVVSAIASTNDGNMVYVGSTNSSNYENMDFAITKTDASGNNKWQKTFNVKQKNVASSIIQTSDGGFVLLGNSGDEMMELVDIAVIKTDANGNKLWQKTFGGDSLDYAYSIIETSNKSLIICGLTKSYGESWGDFIVIKLDGKGNLIWQKTYGGGSYDQAVSVANTVDGGVIIVGNTISKGAGWTDIWVLKLNYEGNIVWDKTLGGSKNDEASQIISTPDNGFIIAGSTKSKGAGDWDMWIVKIDVQGNILWDKTLGGAAEDKATSVCLTFDGGIAVAGYTLSKGAGKKDVWLIKLNFSVREQATAFIQNEINTWQEKGKYEKLEDYYKRVNEITRAQKIKELSNQFFNAIGNPIFEKDKTTAKLEYDSESEIFKISFNYFKPIYLPIPIKEAELFEKNFKTAPFSEIEYNLTQEDRLEIFRVTISANNKKYNYLGSNPVIFNNIVVTNNFKPIEIQNNSNNNATEVIQVVELGNSDVDNNIPSSGKTYQNRYALIIGNGKYQENGSDMVNIKYSINDAKAFKEYCVKIMGVPNDNNHIYFIQDAKATDFKLYVDNFSRLISSQPDGQFYFYYSGHGTVNAQNESFLVPVGVTSSYVDDFAVKLSDLYEKLSPEGNKRVFVFIDACYSGGGKTGQLLVNAKDGLRRTPKAEPAKTNLVVFSASSEDQISQEYFEKQHGLFTYFLLKTLKETKGNITYGKLADKIINDVNLTTANPKNNLKLQKPNINVNPTIEKEWELWKVTE